MSGTIPEHTKRAGRDTPDNEGAGCLNSLSSLARGLVVWLRRKWAFSVIVLLPTFIVAFYLFCIASPQYISEAHFLVKGKSPGEGSLGGLSSLLESSHGGSQNTYAVQDYMMSRDALQTLVRDADIKSIFNRPHADFFAKFPSIFVRNDFESFYNFYKGHVKAQIDQETGISHLTVRSFSANDSQLLVEKLLVAAENLVNKMNDRQRYNTLHSAQEELNNSLQELHDIEMKLALYRYNNKIIDPLKQASPMIGTALSLETSLSMIKAEQKQLDIVAPNSPLRKVYAQRIASLQEQVKKAQENITGHGEKDLSLVPKMLGYDELEIKKTIVEKKIAAEATALEVAKSQADRQMLYVTIVAQPSLPDYASYPRSMIFLLITFLSALTVYATASLLVSGAREHALQ